MTEAVLSVPEVHCGHCVSSIEGAVGVLEGVDSVKVNLESKDVSVTFDDSKLDLAVIATTIEGQGYDIASS
ncbi:MAG: copper ion binding protein [Actinomycetota bacterium]